jgi:DNA repair exonuclease SbcCD ATPase subunit
MSTWPEKKIVLDWLNSHVEELVTELTTSRMEVQQALAKAQAENQELREQNVKLQKHAALLEDAVATLKQRSVCSCKHSDSAACGKEQDNSDTDNDEEAVAELIKELSAALNRGTYRHSAAFPGWRVKQLRGLPYDSIPFL